MTGSVAAHGDGGRTQGRQSNPRRATPQGPTGTYVKAEGETGDQTTQDIAAAAGTRHGAHSERWRLAGGRCGKRLGVWRSVTGKEVGRS